MLDIARQHEGECHQHKCCINAAAFVTVCEKAVDRTVTASYAVQGNKLEETDSGGGVSAARYCTAHMQTNDIYILHEQSVVLADAGNWVLCHCVMMMTNSVCFSRTSMH